MHKTFLVLICLDKSLFINHIEEPATMTKPTTKGENEESNRMWASASFVGVLIIIGLPLWWKTTEVYRVALPYDKINAFDAMSLVIGSELVVLASDGPTAAEVAAQVHKGFEDTSIIKLKLTTSVLPDALRRTLESVADEQEAVEEVTAKYPGVLEEYNQFYLVQRKHLSQDVWLASERVMFFRDAKASATAVEALKRWVYNTNVVEGARAEVADAARRVRFPAAAAYRVLVHVDHHYHIVDDIEDYIGSFLDELSDLHNFTLQSQSLYMLDFDFQAKEVKEDPTLGRHYSVRRDRLPLLLTALEARPAASVPHQPTLHLALLTPPCHLSPLIIYDDDNRPNVSPIQAFLSPQWGGVVVSSPTGEECAGEAWQLRTSLVMGTFVSHLRKLIGIPDTEAIEGAYLEPVRSVRPRAWEVSTLLRLRTVEQLAGAGRTLHSLARLLGEISNIVITDEVGASITAATECIRRAQDLLARGALREAYGEAQRAALTAETAFTDPSLLALLYFPDDQKYAVYIPLFLPVMFPVLLSLKNLYLWLRGKPIHKDKMD